MHFLNMQVQLILFLNCFFETYNILFQLVHLLINLILQIDRNALALLIAIDILDDSSNFTESVIWTFRIIINILISLFLFGTLEIFLRYLLNHFFGTVISLYVVCFFKMFFIVNTPRIYFSFNILLILKSSLSSFWFFPACLLLLN